MREIKFKAWDKDLKRWTNYSIADDLPRFYDKHTGCWKTDKEGKRFILCQYTGLKDKIGREIYEGDIVRGVSFSSWIGVVKFSDEKQAFMVDELCKPYRGNSTVFMNQFNDGFEILGNVKEDKK